MRGLYLERKSNKKQERLREGVSQWLSCQIFSKSMGAGLAPLKFLVNHITLFIPESLSLTFKCINLPKGSNNNITG